MSACQSSSIGLDVYYYKPVPAVEEDFTGHQVTGREEPWTSLSAVTRTEESVSESAASLYTNLMVSGQTDTTNSANTTATLLKDYLIWFTACPLRSFNTCIC